MEEINFLRYYRAGISIGLLLVLLAYCFFIAVCIPAVNAAQTMNSSLNVSGATQNSITWHIDYKTSVRATGAIFDGIEVEGFNGEITRNFTASDLEPNTTHEFCIYKDLINCESATTKTDVLQNDLIFYFALICGIICIIGAHFANRLIGFIGLMFGAYITMLSFSMDVFALVAGIIIALSSVISIFYGKGD